METGRKTDSPDEVHAEGAAKLWRLPTWISQRVQRAARQVRLKSVLVAFSILAASLAVGGGPGAESSAEQASPSQKEAPERKSESAEDAAGNGAGADAQRHIKRLIPDQKVLAGSPDTLFDLANVFRKTEVGRDGDTLLLEVVRNSKDKVAKASIVGEQLQIQWGKVGKSELTIRATNGRTGDYVDNKILVTVWQPDYAKLMMTVIGGLGIFLLGMKNMSEGLQAVAGAGLRRMISKVTDNRLMATGVGCLVTMLVQSSSITTVMVVGFVNSGFMTLSQAIGVIMGANIGTTITGWILALKIGKYGLPILGVGAFGHLFMRRDRVRYLSMALMGLGMVFFGLELMKDGFAIIKDLPEFEAWFQTFDASTYFGVLKCAAVGCMLTFIVQSSSATLGITIGLAAIGVIPFSTAAALVLGENVGTTITAWLASFGTTTNAKRAAYFHIIFNMIGVIWITTLFDEYLDFLNVLLDLSFIRWLAGVDADSGAAVSVTVRIAATHTCFNVVNTILFFPLAGVLARLLERFVPEKAGKEKPHLTNLDVRMLETPVISVEQSRVEVLRMASGCAKMMDWLHEIRLNPDAPQRLIDKAFHREEVLDTVQDEIVAFLTHLIAGNVPHDIVDEARRQLRMADEYESISDYIIVVLKSLLKLRRSNLQFSDDERATLTELHGMVAEYLQLISRAYEIRQPEIITKAHSRGEAITHKVKELRDQFLARMSDARLDPQLSVAYTAQLNAYRRIRDHVLNTAEALAGEK